MRRIPTCHPERPHKGRGLCSTCYNQAQAQGAFAVGPYRQMPRCHPRREHKARGLCEPCYRTYRRGLGVAKHSA